jgi:predicted nucleic acid-binding protein
MIFVDTNVFMYAVGGGHPLKADAREFLSKAIEHRERGQSLCTSAEVLQELLHAYLPVDRLATLDAALMLLRSAVQEIWEVEPDDVLLARALVGLHRGLGARDLLHLASCQRRGVSAVKTYDRALAAAFTR